MHNIYSEEDLTSLVDRDNVTLSFFLDGLNLTSFGRTGVDLQSFARVGMDLTYLH